jgi:hypothetical protein
LKIVCLIAALVAILLGIATVPGFAAEARHRRGEAPASAYAKTLAARKSIPRHKPAAAPRLSIVRDSIGRPVVRPEVPPPIGAGHAGPALRMPAKSIGAVPPVGPGIFNRPAWPKPLAAGAPHGGTQVQHPFGNPSFASRGRIDGAALIRPRLAPTGLGGPAKMSGGIDGTDFHPKH